MLSVLISIIPFLCLFGLNTIISTVNYIEYGTFVTRELNEGSYAELINKLYSIDCDEDISYVSVSQKKLQMIYVVSPTFQSIQTEIEEKTERWDREDRNPGDGEVEDGWFMFMLRDAMDDAGLFENAKKMNRFCEDVVSEIDAGVSENKISINDSMFVSPQFSQWKDRYQKELWEEIKTAFIYTVTFDGCLPEYYSTVMAFDGQYVERFVYSTARFSDVVYFSFTENDIFFYINQIYMILSPVLFSLAIILYGFQLVKWIIHFQRKCMNDIDKNFCC